MSESLDKEVTAKPLLLESPPEPPKATLKKKVSPEKNGEKSDAPGTTSPPPADSHQLDIKLNDKPKNTTTTFNLKQGRFTSDFVKQKTEGEINTPSSTPTDTSSSSKSSSSTSSSSTSSSSESKGGKSKVEEIRAQMLAEEENENNKQTYEDYEDTADMIIDLVDFAVVFLIRAISLDTTDAPYQPSADRVNKLKKHLTRYLIRQNKKFPMGALMLMAIIAAYGTPFRKSLEHRKLVLTARAQKKKEGNQESVKDQQSGNPLKKRPGRQPK